MMDITPLGLASARVSERQFCRRILISRLRVMLAFVVFDILAMAAGFFGMGTVNERHAALSHRLDRTLGESQATQQDLSELRNTQDLAGWRRRRSQNGMRMLDSLALLASALPENSWLSRITAGAKDGVVQVDGGAADLTAVAHLTMTLSSEKAFQDVRLGPSDSMQMDNVQAVKFTLFLKLAGFGEKEGSGDTAEASGKGGAS